MEPTLGIPGRCLTIITCNGTQKSEVECDEQPSRELKWPVQNHQMLQNFQEACARTKITVAVMHMWTTNKYKCKCDAEHMCTETGKHSTNGNANSSTP